jgi:hypothetical protein
MPRNWLRPRFEYTPAAGENLFEITLTAPSFAHHLVIYTTARSYTLDANIWDGLRVSVNDQPVGVSVRALTLSGSGTVQNPPSPPAKADFSVAPVDAPGKIVYWALPSGYGDGVLRGFGVGEEGVEDVLVSSQLVAPTIDSSQNDGCIGCHSATPDELSVGFQLGPHNNGGPHTFYDSIAEIGSGTVGQKPAYVTDGQLAVVRLLRGIPAYSSSHWTTHDHVVLLMDGNNEGQLLESALDRRQPHSVLGRLPDPAGHRSLDSMERPARSPIRALRIDKTRFHSRNRRRAFNSLCDHRSAGHAQDGVRAAGTPCCAARRFPTTRWPAR